MLTKNEYLTKTEKIMLSKLFEEFDSFAVHHQLITALGIISGMVLISWGIESILEHYIFPHKPIYGFLLAIIIGLVLLALTQHFVIRIM